jgi:DNA helicase II / ATP-dependent DNA helicase PcrA
MFRDSRHSRQLELELTRRRVPFRKFGGRRFLEAAPIRDMIYVLKWCENPRDRVAGSRVLQLLPGIGSARATKMLDQLAALATGPCCGSAFLQTRSMTAPLSK